MTFKLNILNLAFALMELKKIRRDSLFSLLKEVLNMALNDTFKILPQNTISLESYLNTYLPKKDYWAEECKKWPSKKRMPFLLRLKFIFFT